MKTINIFFLALCVGCALANAKFDGFGFDLTPRIVGGKDASEGQFPYQVSLRSMVTKKHFCGASILSSRFLLSAAHCSQEINGKPKYVFAVVGALNRVSGGDSYELDTITPHEKWDKKTVLNDISLLRTAKEIVFSDTIQPIALPTQDTPGEIEVLLSGWGYISYSPTGGQSTLPTLLQFTKPNTLSVDGCKQVFKEKKHPANINESILCTINEMDVGACHGDSGGPLVDASNPENKILVGVVSWGIPCGKGYPDAFTRVYSFLDWIGEQIAKQSPDLE
uniref:Chymotrypsin-like serine protease n=1 Tax=Sitodiplosis mosellana TaxID=263140 RepID=E7CCH3_9DIPT|nr:chymotrypsin-like serine protease [Sitodiplosis mosellana]